MKQSPKRLRPFPKRMEQPPRRLKSFQKRMVFSGKRLKAYGTLNLNRKKFLKQDSYRGAPVKPGLSFPLSVKFWILSICRPYACFWANCERVSAESSGICGLPISESGQESARRIRHLPVGSWNWLRFCMLFTATI